MPISLSDRQLIILPFFENIFNNKHGTFLVFGCSPNDRASGHARTPDCAAARLTAIHSCGHGLPSANMYDESSALLGACSTSPALSLLSSHCFHHSFLHFLYEQVYNSIWEKALSIMI